MDARAVALPRRFPSRTLRLVDWKEAIRAWRALPPAVRLRREWDQIPENAAASMAFEGEPVDLDQLRADHARRPLPPGLKPSEDPSV